MAFPAIFVLFLHSGPTQDSVSTSWFWGPGLVPKFFHLQRDTGVLSIENSCINRKCRVTGKKLSSSLGNTVWS